MQNFTVVRGVCGLYQLSLLRKMKRFVRESVSDINIPHTSLNYKDFCRSIQSTWTILDICLWLLGRDGEFYWESTGESFGIFDDWMEGEPVLGFTDYHCGYISIDAELNINNTNRWRNGYCGSLSRFICESVPVSKQLQIDTAVGKMNHSHRFSIKNSVYDISTDKVRSHFFNATTSHWFIIYNGIQFFSTNATLIKLNISFYLTIKKKKVLNYLAFFYLKFLGKRCQNLIKYGIVVALVVDTYVC